MTINLYNCTAENEVVDKTSYMSGNVSTSCEMVNTDVLNPVLKLSSNFLDKNYVLIPDFENRYYFVSSIEMLRGGHMLMNCHIDVLMTYRAYILQTTCNIVRQENAPNNKLVDNYCTVNVNKKNDIKNIGKVFGDNVTENARCYMIGVM